MATVESLARNGSAWTAKTLHLELTEASQPPSLRTVLRGIDELIGDSLVSSAELVENGSGKRINPLIVPALKSWLSAKRYPLEILQLITSAEGDLVVMVNSKGRLIWKAAGKRGIRQAISEVVQSQGGRLALLLTAPSELSWPMSTFRRPSSISPHFCRQSPFTLERHLKFVRQKPQLPRQS